MRVQAKKMEYKELHFDSETELRYFQHLEKDVTVKDIKLQSQYQIIEPYEVECKKCGGLGKVLNQRTSNLNKCGRCKGGKVTKAGAVYTADFLVEYIDGFKEVVDVKGFRAERDFSLRKKLFEQQTGTELIVIRWDAKNKRWKRD